MKTAPEHIEWEELAAFDPLWAVLSEPARKGGGWDLETFLATGDEEVKRGLARCDALGLPRQSARALDFGCGVGRCIRALSNRFEDVLAVDTAPTMIARGRQLHMSYASVSFESKSLEELELASFDLVWSVLVLQHLPPADLEPTIAQFVRLLRPGGVAVFQVPWTTRRLHRLNVSRNAFRMLRRLGVSAPSILRRTPLTPMRMSVLPPERVEAAIVRAGGRLLAVEPYEDEVPTPSKRYIAALQPTVLSARSSS